VLSPCCAVRCHRTCAFGSLPLAPGADAARPARAACAPPGLRCEVSSLPVVTGELPPALTRSYGQALVLRHF